MEKFAVKNQGKCYMVGDVFGRFRYSLGETPWTDLNRRLKYNARNP